MAVEIVGTAFCCVEITGETRTFLCGPSFRTNIGDALVDSSLGSGDGDRDVLLSGVHGIGEKVDGSIRELEELRRVFKLVSELLFRTFLNDALRETYSDVSKKASNLLLTDSIVFMDASVLRGDSDSHRRPLCM